ncbi:MAG: hypothetical protein NTY15_07755 [Planctomycetota bacterium]|nr:hypothetical protein [Planctomycetota bacterium]
MISILVLRDRPIWFKKRFHLIASFLLVLALGYTIVHPGIATAQLRANKERTGYVSIESVNDVMDQWSEDKHLYVKGDLGVPDASLDELQQWLNREGLHWTVVLMQESSGEYYVAPDGRSYFGMDAVEFALGKGLANRTGFGKLENPLTHETDGAMFVLFLKERKFSYFGSEAQDRRGLGRSKWIGELDQPAFRAMRGGGRVVDAVKETVRTINQRLNRMVSSEAEAARTQTLERERDLQTAKEGLSHLTELVDQVGEESVAFRAQRPEATGALAKPDIEEWRKRISQIEVPLQLENAKESHQTIKQLGTQIDSYLNAYAASRGYEANRKELESEFGPLANAPNGVAAGPIKELRELLAAADKKHRNGDMELTETLRQAETKIAEGNRRIDDENRRMEADKANAKLVRQVVGTIAGILTAIVAMILWLFHRKRKPAMIRAIDNLKTREESVSKETDGLDQLFTQCADLIGSRERIAQRGYTGRTRELGEGAINDIDDLFIMSKEIRRVLAEAKGLVNPKGMWDQIVNAFSSAKFEESVRQISGKPLKFSRATGIPRVAMDILKKRAQDANEPIPNEVPDHVILTFDEIYGAIQSRRERAGSALKLIEDSLTRVNDELNRCQADLQGLLDQEKRIANASAGGWFPVPNYFNVLIPSVQSDLADAESQSTLDAVSAMEGPIRRARRKLDEAKALGEWLLEFRKGVLPELKSMSDKLKAMGYPTAWLESELRIRSSIADRLFEQAAAQSIDGGFAELKESMVALVGQTQQALELAEILRDTTQPRVEQLPQDIQAARKELASQLKLNESQVLVEPAWNPDTAHALARKSWEAAVTMLRQGKIDACRAAIQGCDSEMERAGQWIEVSKTSAKEFESTLAKEQSRLQQVVQRSKQLALMVRNAERNYSSAALQLAYSVAPIADANWVEPERNPSVANPHGPASDGPASDGPASDGPASDGTAEVEDGDRQVLHLGGDHASQLLEHARDYATECDRLHASAQSKFRQGMVLQAVGELQQAGGFLTQMDRRHDRVDEHLQQLERQVVENQKSLVKCISDIQHLQDYRRDRMVTIPTIQQIDALGEQLQSVQSQYRNSTEGTNPFEFTQLLLFFQKRIAELEGMVVSDRHGYAEAARAVDGAARQWNVAKQFVQQSRTDNIPDSPATTEGVRRIDGLERAVIAVQRGIEAEHGDWEEVGRRAAETQSDLSEISRQLSSELQQANAALTSFQAASESVYKAEHWTGPWGLRISDSPGVRQLEAARVNLQRGQYSAVLELSNQALQASQLAIQKMEREVQNRRIEAQMSAERLERERRARRNDTILIGSGPSIFGSGSPWPNSGGFGGGVFGGGGGFGGGGSSSGGGSSGGGSSSSGDDSSGFSRSGW